MLHCFTIWDRTIVATVSTFSSYDREISTAGKGAKYNQDLKQPLHFFLQNLYHLGARDQVLQQYKKYIR